MDFSFIIPVYNCKPYLSACVESILACQVPSTEVILVDDGSTDGSAVLCDALARKDSRIRVLHQANAGVSAARNVGLSTAKGSHILFADADDTLDTEALKRMLTDPRCFQADLTLFGVSFDYYHHGNCYRSEPLFYSKEGNLTPQQWGRDLVSLYMSNSLSSSCTKAFKRSIIVENTLALNTDMFLYEDMEFVLRYLACCKSIMNVPYPIYHYRQSEDEGNAGRRLSRISGIPAYLAPVEEAFRNLSEANDSVSPADCETILQRLHLLLAREKISVSDMRTIRSICQDYRAWEPEHISTPERSMFRTQLMKEQVASILFHRLKGNARHRLAVFIKSAIHRFRRKGTSK